jgi:hypothetical protein
MSEQIRVRDVHADDLPEVLDLLLERLGLQLWREKTPDYTAYELRSAGTGERE